MLAPAPAIDNLLRARHAPKLALLEAATKQFEVAI